jgi:hypothetical protein
MALRIEPDPGRRERGVPIDQRASEDADRSSGIGGTQPKSWVADHEES